MADEKLVSFESVAAAADAILADPEDGKPSVRKIKARLGGGSPNAILGYYREWQAGRPMATDTVVEVSETVLNAIRGEMNRAADKAGRLAQEKAAELDEQLEDVRGELAEQAATKKAQAGRIEELLTEIATAEKNLAKLADQIEAVKAAKAEGEARLTQERNAERERADGLADSLATAKSRLEALAGIERERDELKTDLDVERNRLTDSEKRAAVAQAQADAESRRADQAEKREAQAVEKLEKQVAELKAELADSRKETDKAKAGMAQVAEKWQEELRAEVQRSRDLEKQVAELKAEGKSDADS